MKSKKKLKSHQIKFIINMIAITIFAVSYLYVYSSYVDKTEAAYDELEKTKKEISKKEKKIAEEDNVLKETEEIKATIQKMIDAYPVNISKVDNLMFVEQMQKDLGIEFTNIVPTDSSKYFVTALPIRNADGTIADLTVDNSEAGKEKDKSSSSEGSSSENNEDSAEKSSEKKDKYDELEISINETSSTSGSKKKENKEEAAPTTMSGLQSTITMNFQITYAKFKQLADYIAKYPDKTIISSVSISADNTTGMLTGTLVLKRFALSGSGKVYEAPVIDDISIGTDNIFGIDPNANDNPENAELQDETLTEP